MFKSSRARVAQGTGSGVITVEDEQINALILNSIRLMIDPSLKVSAVDNFEDAVDLIKAVLPRERLIIISDFNLKSNFTCADVWAAS